jgi:hypothetical protein
MRIATRVIAGADLVDQPTQVLQREAGGTGERLLRPQSPVTAGPVGAEQPSDRIGALGRPVGQQRAEVDLSQVSIRRAVKEARIQHPDHAAAAEIEQLARGFAPEPLGRLEAHDHDLQRTQARVFEAHDPTVRRAWPARLMVS